MRRTAAVLGTALVVGAGALVVLPGSASAVAVPTLVSVSASPGSVTTIGKLNQPRKVTVTAVYNDPDNQLSIVAFSNSVPLTPGLSTNAKDFSAETVGTRKTFSWTFNEDYNSKPGIRSAYVVGKKAPYGDTNIDGTAGSTSYVVKNQPLVSLRGAQSLGYIWKTKARLVGNLTSTPDHANKKITIQFDKKGKQKGKQWKTLQTVSTTTSGSFQTKKFKINTPGTYRAVSAKTTYVLSASGTFKVFRP